MKEEQISPCLGYDGMQLHSGAELFGKVIYRGIITRGCS
jgi:hypothetical protein